MSGLVLVLNSGSSSIKYQLVEPVAGTAVASGLVERIGEPDGCVTYSFGDKRFERCGAVAFVPRVRLSFWSSPPKSRQDSESDAWAAGCFPEVCLRSWRKS